MALRSSPGSSQMSRLLRQDRPRHGSTRAPFRLNWWLARSRARWTGFPKWSCPRSLWNGRSLPSKSEHGAVRRRRTHRTKSGSRRRQLRTDRPTAAATETNNRVMMVVAENLARVVTGGRRLAYEVVHTCLKNMRRAHWETLVRPGRAAGWATKHPRSGTCCAKEQYFSNTNTRHLHPGSVNATVGPEAAKIVTARPRLPAVVSRHKTLSHSRLLPMSAADASRLPTVVGSQPNARPKIVRRSHGTLMVGQLC